MLRRILKVALPLALVLVAAAFAVALVKSRPKPKRAKPAKESTLVDVALVTGGKQTLKLQATGTVTAERTVNLQPQISAVILSEANGFEAGRRFKKGEEIVRLDDRDAALALRQRKAAAAAARLEVTLEKGRAHVAQQEWQMLGKTVSTTRHGKDLALRLPQQQAARARVAQADAAVAQAKLALSRVALTAPFDCVVQNKRATVGQLVGPGSSIATLVGTDRFFVTVSLPVASLSAVAVPGLNTEGQGSLVRVSQVGEGAMTSRAGRILRLLSDLDSNGRMARLLVSVERPLDRPGEATGAWTPLLIGSYVRVEIEGRQVTDAVAVPRVALREGGRVWVVRDGKLAFQPVDVFWRRESDVLVRGGGLRPGDALVTSRLSAPTPGMSVTVRGSQSAEASAEKGQVRRAPKGEAKP